MPNTALYSELKYSGKGYLDTREDYADHHNKHRMLRMIPAKVGRVSRNSNVNYNIVFRDQLFLTSVSN